MLATMPKRGNSRTDDRLSRSAPPPVTCLPHQPVGQPATKKGRDRPGKQHQRGQPARQVRRGPARFLQVGRIPRIQQFRHRRHRDDGTAQEPDIGAGNHPLPGDWTVDLMLVIREIRCRAILRNFRRRTRHSPRGDQPALGVVGLGMLGRIIAEPDVKGECPADADQGEDGKRPSPADPVDQPLRGRVRGRAAEQHRRRDDPLGTPARRIGKPLPQDPRRVRQGPRLAGPEQESNDDQRRESPGRARQRREERPPEHDPRQDAPRAVSVAPPTGRNLEECVSQCKRIEDDAPSASRRSPIPS